MHDYVRNILGKFPHLSWSQTGPSSFFIIENKSFTTRNFKVRNVGLYILKEFIGGFL